jgi:hypothetical protein
MRFFAAAALAIVSAGLVFGLYHHGGHAVDALRVTFVSGDRVDEIDLAGGHRHTLSSGARAEGFTLLPDGTRVETKAGPLKAAELVHVDSRGRPLAALGPGLLPAVSPDGTRLAVTVMSATRQNAELWVVNVDGSGRRQLTRGAYDTLPEWSPDGSTVLFTRVVQPAFTAEATKSWLETVPAIGGRPHRLTSSGYDAVGRYSPDGRQIAFGSARDKAGKLCGEDECTYRFQVYLMRADGSGAHRITTDFLASAPPAFAGSTTIVYSRAQPGTYLSELYRIDLDGSCRRRLTHDALDDTAPAVVPAASRTDLPCPQAHRALPPGSNFNTKGSTLTPAGARAWRGLPLYWVGDPAGPFVLSEISVEPIHTPGLPASKTAYVIYTCSPPSGDCTRQLGLIMTPDCARPTFPATGPGALSRTRGVPRIRYADRDELLVGRTIITIYGDAPARELAERELRSFSRSAGNVTADQPLPAPPHGILDGLACQPPAVLRARLPPHP